MIFLKKKFKIVKKKEFGKNLKILYNSEELKKTKLLLKKKILEKIFIKLIFLLLFWVISLYFLKNRHAEIKKKKFKPKKAPLKKKNNFFFLRKTFFKFCDFGNIFIMKKKKKNIFNLKFFSFFLKNFWLEKKLKKKNFW